MKFILHVFIFYKVVIVCPGSDNFRFDSRTDIIRTGVLVPCKRLVKVNDTTVVRMDYGCKVEYISKPTSKL